MILSQLNTCFVLRVSNLDRIELILKVASLTSENPHSLKDKSSNCSGARLQLK